MNIKTFAIDLAKERFQIHGFDEHHQRQLTRRLGRASFIKFFLSRRDRPRLIMEACRGAHHWGRYFSALGYPVELIAPHHTRPFVQGNKTDASDADAIYEAACRPRLQRVPIKSPEQQALQALHRVREGWCRDRTRTINQLRGLLAEFGLEFALGPAALRRALPDVLADGDNGLPHIMRTLAAALAQTWAQIDQALADIGRQIQASCRASSVAGRLCGIDGVGPLTATALVAAVGQANSFNNARQFAASLGVVPREHSSGDRRQLGAITKRGNVYLRTLLVHGGRAVVRASRRRQDPRSQWVNALAGRIGPNKAAVAVANKNARIIWALLRSGQDYRPSTTIAALTH
jgi:transposase